jgi:DNA polymerase
MTYYIIDFETRSSVCLKTYGLRNYIDSPDFELIVSVAQEVGSDEQIVEELDFPALYSLLDTPTVKFVAHNAVFEYNVVREIQRRRGLAPLPLIRFHCTALLARAMGLPGSLDGVSRLLFKDGKVSSSQAMITKFCTPPYKGVEDAQWPEFVEYCKNDVAMTKRLWEKLPPVPALTREYWLCVGAMNDKGFLVDQNLINKVLVDVELKKHDDNELVDSLTNQAVNSVTQVKRLRDWLASIGIETEKLNNETVTELLERKDLPDGVFGVLHARLSSGKATFGKYKAFGRRADKTHRVKNDYVPYGAHTGRLTGAGSQPQNITTSDVTTINPETGTAYSTQELAEAYLKNELPDAVPKSQALRGMIRGAIIAPDGWSLYVADYAGIEARIATWLAGHEDILELYRKGEDLYIPMAAVIHRIPESDVTKKQRNAYGKVTVLGGSYGMGPSKFAAQYRVTEAEAKRCIEAYRARYHKVPALWSALEHAFIQCLVTGLPQKTHGVAFEVVKGFMKMTPPGGRPIWYLRPKVVPGKFGGPSIQYQKANWVGATYPKHLWGGVLLENICQNIAGVIMSTGQLNLYRMGHVASLQTHDEIIIEVPDGTGLAPLDAALIRMPLGMFDGLPLASESCLMKRYGK